MDTIVFENIVNMWSRLDGQCQKNAVWLINPDTFPQLATMAFEGTSSPVPDAFNCLRLWTPGFFSLKTKGQCLALKSKDGESLSSIFFPSISSYLWICPVLQDQQS